MTLPDRKFNNNQVILNYYVSWLIYIVNENNAIPKEFIIRHSQSDIERMVIKSAFARLDSVAMAAAVGLVLGVGLFLATAILLLKAPQPGFPVGDNLSALRTVLFGYSVSWIGAVVGAVYAAAIGAVIGYVFAVMWNFTHFLFIGIAATRVNWFD